MALPTRSSSSAVKEEFADGEEIIHKAPIPRNGLTPIAPPGNPEPLIKRLRNVVRDPQGATATAAVDATAAGAPPHASPVSTSRFFPPSLSSLRGQKRKAASGPALLTGRRSLRLAVKTGDDARCFPKNAATRDSAKTSTEGLAVPTAFDTQRRSSSRANEVKMEESAAAVKFEEHFSALAGAGAGGRAASKAAKGDPSKKADRKPSARRAAVEKVSEEKVEYTEKKPERKVGKAARKVKIEAQAGAGATRLEKSRDKPVPPRLAEKAALIVQVMDKLYPNPPIPINHMVRVY